MMSILADCTTLKALKINIFGWHKTKSKFKMFDMDKKAKDGRTFRIFRKKTGSDPIEFDVSEVKVAIT